MTGSKSVKSPPNPGSEELGVSLKGSPEEGHRIQITDEDAIRTLFGTKHEGMAEALLGQCLKVLNNDEASDAFPSNDERGFMVAAIAEIEPRDTFERMLAVQMASTHVAMIRSGRWLATCDRLDQVNAHYNGYTKLARAYVAQMEALRKHRNGGKQTVTEHHVNVQDGGQAIVGIVSDQGKVSYGK